MALTDNLVAYYKLDESSGNPTDSTGGGFTLTNNGTTGFSSGLINNGIDFTSTNSSKWLNRVPDILSYATIGSAWSMQFWIKCQDHSATNRICRYVLNNGATERNFTVDIGSDGKVAFTTFDGTSRSVTGTTVLSTTAYYQIIVTYTGAQMVLYVNNYLEGTPISFSWSGFARTTLSNFSIGAEQLTNGGATSSYFKGLIDEVGVWSKTLSTLERLQLYNGGVGLSYPLTPTSSLSTLNTG